MTHWGEVKQHLRCREFQICQPQGSKPVSFSYTLSWRALSSPDLPFVAFHSLWETLFQCSVFLNSWAHNFQKPILGNNIWLTKYICKKKIYFCLFPYLILENIVQPGLSMKYLILVWLPELRVSPFFRVRKPMLTTSSAFLAVTAWIPV